MKNYISKFKLSRLEVIIAINGGAVLVLEIIGARLMAPFFGTSIYVWTAIIGVILLALSVGYWYGGILADKGASQRNLSVLFLFIAIILSVELALQPTILEYLADSSLSLRLSAFLAAMSVYALPATMMGLVSPYITKLSIKTLKHSGETVGRLYAAGTIGSILGTFLSGYWLTGYFTNESINWSVVIVFIILAVATHKKIVKDSLFWICAVCVGLLLVFATSDSLPETVVYQQDTPYARYQVIDRDFKGKQARFLVTDRFGIQSGIFINEPEEPAFEYLKNFIIIAENYTEPQEILVVGGGAYTLPMILSDMYPEAIIDTVEIDNELEQISIDYFGYEPSNNVRNIVEDGRTFLNSNEKKYDLIYLDAFSANQPPFQLSTLESFQQVQKSLSDEGIVAFNIIGGQTGTRSKYTSAMNNTFSRVFDTSGIYSYAGSRLDVSQNMLIVGSNGIKLDRFIQGMDIKEPIIIGTDIVFTDSYAPTDRYIFN